MIRTFQSDWWFVVLRGTLSILLGLFALLWPEVTATTVILIIAVFIAVDGLITLIAAVRARGDRSRVTLGAVEGGTGLIIGLIALLAPQLALGVVAVLVGVWALVTGVLEIASAAQLRAQMSSAWLLGSAGVLSVLLGLAMIISPGTGVVLITVLIGIYGLLAGVSLVGLGIRMRGMSAA